MTEKNKILIVDDLKKQLDIYQSILGDTYELRLCISPAIALEFLKKERYDLIITDVEMGEISGYEFIYKLRNILQIKEVPIIVISYDENIMLSIKIGANDYMRKPVKPIELKQMIKDLLNSDDKKI